MITQVEHGLGPFDPLAYAELDLDEYRRRFPAETDPLSDEQIWDVVGLTEDDLTDDGWREAFAEAAR